jgi:hypothetical protein
MALGFFKILFNKAKTFVKKTLPSAVNKDIEGV